MTMKTECVYCNDIIKLYEEDKLLSITGRTCLLCGASFKLKIIKKEDMATCFWCSKKIKVEDFLEHSNEEHPKFTPRSYDFNGKIQ